ncbi:MAG TPA: hypothetical protein GXZ74_05055 [Tissierellia bacterium]|nr:hypothetical protein [Tissierellia bacterium]
MIYLKRLIEDSFQFEGKQLKRRFPQEYLLALDEDEATVIGYAKLDLLANKLLCLVGPVELQPELRKYVIWLFEEMGESVMVDESRGLPVRVDLREVR